jgi:hypothetical protein
VVLMNPTIEAGEAGGIGPKSAVQASRSARVDLSVSGG